MLNIYIVAFLSFRAYNADNKLIIDTVAVMTICIRFGAAEAGDLRYL